MTHSTVVKLSASVFLHKPENEINTRESIDGPRLIVLATWAFAQDNHIAKYIAQHRKLFPNATILVAKCFLRHMFWIPTAREELVPAVSLIRSILDADTDKHSENTDTTSSKSSLLLHVFSNTGLSTTSNPCEVYKTVTSTNLPPHATIFDSTPGRYEYRSIVSALMFGVPRGRWLQRLVSLPLAHFLSGFLFLWVRILGWQDWVVFWGNTVNDPTQILETYRSYAYSSADPLVEFRVVEAHAEDAQMKGFSVLHRVNFVDSDHVSHARIYPERYCSLVEDTWRGAVNNVDLIMAVIRVMS